ncbi:MAG TPA: hypothetical protein DCG12_18765 [Planctomycetaceae bacterium]|nr:hypothetical protein [Planctomycetaceae bacterium]
MNHGGPLVRVTFGARLNTRLAADATAWVHEELKIGRDRFQVCDFKLQSWNVYPRCDQLDSQVAGIGLTLRSKP